MTPDPILQASSISGGRYNESAEICVGILAGKRGLIRNQSFDGLHPI